MHNLFGVVGLLLVPILWLIGLIRPRTFSRNGTAPGRGKVTIYALLAFVVSMVTFSVTVPVDNSSGNQTAVEAGAAPTAPSVEKSSNRLDRISGYSRHIERVFQLPSGGDQENLNIEIKLLDGWSNSSAFNATAEAILNILKEVKADYPGAIGEVAINVSVDVVDKYNNPSKQDAILMVFDMPEVEKVNFENLLNQRLLNNFVTSAGSSNIGKEILKPWCAENASSADRFCSLILK